MEYKAILDDGSRHDVIRHFGILGMHWGERRYQNSDGSLTEAGRKRYNRGSKRKTNGDAQADKKPVSPGAGPAGGGETDEALQEELRRLQEKEGAGELSAAEHARMQAIKRELYARTRERYNSAIAEAEPKRIKAAILSGHYSSPISKEDGDAVNKYLAQLNDPFANSRSDIMTPREQIRANLDPKHYPGSQNLDSETLRQQKIAMTIYEGQQSAKRAKSRGKTYGRVKVKAKH